MRKAIATLAIGTRYKRMLHVFALPTWRVYARRHGYEIVCFDCPLDETPRAAARSPAWQKLLILGRPELAGFDAVVWLDTDIVVNPGLAPCIVAATPRGKLGICEQTEIPDLPLLSLMRAAVMTIDEHHRQDLNVGGIYAAHGFADPPARIFNTGVMVLDRLAHRAFLERVYAAYDDVGPGGAYEMGPLSYEIARGAVESATIDPKFKALYLTLAAAFGNIHQPLEPVLDGRAALIAAMLSKVYFLHFAGHHPTMEMLRYIGLRGGVARLNTARARAALATPPQS